MQAGNPLQQEVWKRRYAEAALRESEDRFRGAFEHASIGMALVAPDGRWLQVNRSLCDLLGYEEGELLKTTFQAVTFSQDQELHLDSMRRMLAGEISTSRISQRCVHKQAHLVPVLLSASIVRGADDEARYFVAQLQDTSDQVRADEATRRLAGIVESSQDAIYSTTLEMIVQSWNAAAEKIFGYSATEMIGRPSWILVPPERREESARILEGLRRGVGVDRFRTTRICKNDRTIHVSLTASPLKDPAGSVVGFSVISHDITRHTHLEQQLRQSQKMDAIGRLAGGVAHDFNNMLAVITGYAELLLFRGGLDPSTTGYLEEIRTAGDRAADLTRQLLAFSRSQLLASQVLQINEIVSGMERMLGRLIGEDVDLLVLLGADVGMVRADPGQMELVLMNLAVNARDAMPRGGKLLIETTNLDVEEVDPDQSLQVRPGRYVRVSVTDSGFGMDKETLSHIFEPFFTTKEQGLGTGLGLATVYGIVKQSGGEICAYSEPGQGTTFKIYLPRVMDEATVEAPFVPPAVPSGGSETILLVEDETIVRALVRDVLRTNGYQVLDAADGGEALRLCEQHEGRIHLLVTDVVMPGMSGRELAQRAARLRPGIYTLFMSGYMDAAVVGHGVLEAEMAFLQKPFTPSTLARRVREVLDAAPEA